jgi:hypothetical protein
MTHLFHKMRQRWDSRVPELRLVALGALAVAAYAGLYCLQRSMREHFVAPALGYVLVTVITFLVYGAILSMSRHGELDRPRARAWALALPCFMNLLLVPCVPVLSQDVFSYMAHGFFATLPQGNPLTQPAYAARDTALGPILASYGWTTDVGITPYGIIWTQIEVGIMKLCGVNVPAALVLFKTVVTAASLGTAYCLWSFLGRVRPADQLTGTLAYLWNPLFIVEFAAEGHNDAVMLLFVAAALLGCAAQRPFAATFAQLCAVTSKYVPILFAPAQLVFLWKGRRSTAQLTIGIIAAIAAAGVLAALLYAPLWVGSHSFDGLLRRGEPISSATLFGGLNWILRRSPLRAHSGLLTLALIYLPLLGFIGWRSQRVTDADSLARAFAWIAVAYALAASPDYWPWYVCMPVALVIVADTDRLLWLAVLMSFTARLCAPLDLLREHHFISKIIAKGALTGVGATLPLIALLVYAYLNRKRSAAA